MLKRHGLFACQKSYGFLSIPEKLTIDKNFSTFLSIIIFSKNFYRIINLDSL